MQRKYSKAIERAEVHYQSHITYNDARGETIEKIDGELDVRIFKDGKIHFRFWPKGYTTDDEIHDFELNLKELLNIEPAIDLIRSIKDA